MFSDNENPGAELSAGQTATAATPAPEQTENVEAAQAVAKAQETMDTVPTPPAEPAVVTEHPAEPVAAPDGLAAVEHTNVSDMVEEAVDSGEPAT
ncbi:MAG TPA: hypothetical protein VHS29_04895, partial [Candidatus Acidoferrales bacterium]|nr:hypothetical protein [Candidatus Acidoferrales bacterium]